MTADVESRLYRAESWLNARRTEVSENSRKLLEDWW